MQIICSLSVKIMLRKNEGPNMRKLYNFALYLIPQLLLSSSVAFSQDTKLLNIYNWSDYINPSVIDAFEKEYGIKVNYDIYDTSEIVDTKLLAGRSGYDVVFHGASFASRLLAIGVFQSLDKSKLSNWGNLDPIKLEAIEEFDPGNRFGMPYMWGTTGVTYNADMIEARLPNAPVDSYDLIFDPAVISKFSDCGVSFLDDPTSVVPMGMIYLGHPFNSVEPEHLEAVEELFTAVRPYIKYFSSSKLTIDLPSREVCIAMSWSGDYAVAITRAREVGIDLNLKYAIPREGGIGWYDMVFIPADASHSDNAHLFLNYLLRPDVIATVTNYIGYANANQAANPLIIPEYYSDVAIYPDDETFQSLEITHILEPTLERRRSRTWTRIKSGL
jgi:putrescine transport system substrate-binding protein